jgi:hypothetical protein
MAWATSNHRLNDSEKLEARVHAGQSDVKFAALADLHRALSFNTESADRSVIFVLDTGHSLALSPWQQANLRRCRDVLFNPGTLNPLCPGIGV